MAGLTSFFGVTAIVIHTRLPYSKKRSVFFVHLQLFVLSALLCPFPYDAATLTLVFHFWPTYSRKRERHDQVVLIGRWSGLGRSSVDFYLHNMKRCL